VALRDPRLAILVATGCIGAIVSVLLLFPAVGAMVFPSAQGLEDGAFGNASTAGLENGTVLLAEPVSDDERLESLVAGAGIPLLELSIEQIHAIHTQDNAALQEKAVELSSLVEILSVEAATLEISPESESIRSHFIAALDEFAAAGTLLDGGIPVNQDVTDDALRHLATGTERLLNALEDCNRPAADDPDTLLASIEPDEEPQAAFPDALLPGERFCYVDTRGENSASLIVGPITWSRTLQTTGAKPVQYTAESGKTYLLVAVRATHLGHKGDGINTRLQTPTESAFTLHYAVETYRPLTSPGPTSQGGSYSRTVIDRGEYVTGYLFFEVPEDLDPARAYLQASIGEESPVWVLGNPV
jgi:hypothetical protein